MIKRIAIDHFEGVADVDEGSLGALFPLQQFNSAVVHFDGHRGVVPRSGTGGIDTAQEDDGAREAVGCRINLRGMRVRFAPREGSQVPR